MVVGLVVVAVVPCALVSGTTLLSSGPTPCEGGVRIRIGSTAEVIGTAFCCEPTVSSVWVVWYQVNSPLQWKWE